MAKVAVISAEGVLVQRDDPRRPFLTSVPLAEGVTLMNALSAEYLVVVATERTERPQVVEWLDLHGLTQVYSYVVARRPEDAELDAAELTVAQLDYLRGAGFTVALWVGSDPDSAVSVLGKGVPAVVFAHPVYGRMEWRPDVETGVRPWDVLTAEVERHRLLKARDGRLNVDPEDVLDGRWEREEADA